MILKKNINVLNENEYEANIVDANTDFLNLLELNNYVLPNETPVEIHPYLTIFELQPLVKYIIGTFPPIQYLRDSLNIPNGVGNINSRPKIPFFHGQKCDQWQFFLNEQELENLGVFNPNNENITRIQQRDNINAILTASDVNYSDIIYSAKRRSYDANDDSLKNIVPNLTLICQILKNHKSKYLNFNSSTLFNGGNDFGFYMNNHGVNNIGDLQYKVKSYELFLKTLVSLGFKLELKLNPNDDWVLLNIGNSDYFSNNYKYKTLTKLRVFTEHLIEFENEQFENFSKEYTVITGPSPSASANITLGNNPIYINWLEAQNNINNDEPLTHIFRKEFYGLFRNNPDELVNWNVY